MTPEMTRSGYLGMLVIPIAKTAVQCVPNFFGRSLYTGVLFHELPSLRMFQLERTLIEKCWLCATAYSFEFLLMPNAGGTWIFNMTVVSLGNLNLKNQVT